MQQAPDKKSSSIEEQVYAEQVRLLYKALPGSVISNFVAGLLIVGVQWPVIPSATLLTWLFIFYIVFFLRGLLYIRYRKAVSIENYRYWGNAFSFWAGMSGVLWGTAGIVMFPAGDDLHQMTLIFALIAMSAGSVSSHSFLKAPPCIYVILTLTPLFFRFLYEASSLSYFLATVLLMGVIYMLSSTNRTCESTANNIRMRLNAIEKEKEVKMTNEALEKANRAKDEFLSSMSHELRTPLNAILGFGQLLERESEGDVSKEYAHEIVIAGHHLLRLINDILDLSKIESGDLGLNLEKINLNEVINGSLSLIKPIADEHNITITNGVSESQYYTILTDRIRINQILLNLLSNAVKYNKKSGHISLSCEEIPQKRLRISITDTGTGLTEEQQSRLFIPFERIGAENTEISGTGIGLVITKRLLESMGGKLGVKSKPGVGSTFWIEVERADAPERDCLAHAKEPGDEAYNSNCHSIGKTVLYIEDNAANLRLVTKIINTHTRHKLLSASSAEEGFDIAKEQRPDLILMDINMPGMSGYEAIECLQDNEITRHIPIVAVSSNAKQSDLEQGKNAGFREYLTKPVDVKKLVSTINRLV